MATGDITAVRINTSGWYAEIDIEGLDVGGTYTLGIGTNNDPATAKVVFTVTSNGYTDAGATTTIERTVYGTYRKRKVYPDNASADETDNTTYVTVRVALSDWIYGDDTVEADISSGFYTEGGNSSNAASSVEVTNNSEEDYPKVIANWTWPGWTRITGSSFKLRCAAFHRSAQQKRPVRCVKFTATDEHSNSVSVTVTNPIIDPDMSADAVPVIEYVGEISTTTLTDGDLITCNFTAYPWYGDSGSLIDTSDAVNTMPTPLYAPQYWLLDKADSYGVTIAVVDATSGNDGTGAVVDKGSFDSESPPNAYATIYAAANAIAAYNNTNHSRNNCGGGIIYLKEGTHIFSGGTISAAGQASAETWTTIAGFPGSTRANVLIGSASGTKQIGEKLKIENIKITNSTTVGFTGMDYLWAHSCEIDPSGGATFYVNRCLYFTHSNLKNRDEYRPYSTVNGPRCLVRGCTTGEAVNRAFNAYVLIGNNLVFGTGDNIANGYSGQTQPDMVNIIVAFNRIEKTGDSRILSFVSTNGDQSHNSAIVQNIFVKTVAAGASPLLFIYGDASTLECNNILLFCNTFLGQRVNIAYNDYNLNDIGPLYHKHWQLRGNIFDDLNIVTDVDSHGGTPDADRYGNHGLIHGCGMAGNVVLNRVGTTSYEPDFGGLFFKRDAPLAPNFVDDNTNSETGGDYHPTATSPFLNFIPSGSAVLPYDISGVARRDDGTGCIGAYEYQSVVKIPMMMRHFAARRR